jgi:hypothetical protein
MHEVTGQYSSEQCFSFGIGAENSFQRFGSRGLTKPAGRTPLLRPALLIDPYLRRRDVQLVELALTHSTIAPAPPAVQARVASLKTSTGMLTGVPSRSSRGVGHNEDVGPVVGWMPRTYLPGFLWIRLRSLTPGPPPFSSMNSMLHTEIGNQQGIPQLHGDRRGTGLRQSDDRVPLAGGIQGGYRRGRPKSEPWPDVGAVSLSANPPTPVTRGLIGGFS